MADRGERTLRLSRRRRIGPANLLEQPAQAQAALGVEHGHVGDAAGQVGAEIVVTVTILLVGAAADAVGQDGLETVVLAPPKIGPDVQDNAGNLLADALAHEVRLARVDLEPFLQGDAAHVDVESPQAALEFFVSGEDQVVGVARVTSADSLAQTC